MEGVREVFRKQMQEQAEEANRRDESFRKATSNDNEQKQLQASDRAERLTSDYERNLQAKSNQFNESLSENREVQHQAIEENRENLARDFDGKLKAIKQERNVKVSGLQKGYDDYRLNAESRLKDQELRHFQDQQRGSDALLRAVNRERFSAQDQQEQMREGFKDGIEKTQERFEQKAVSERQLNGSVRDQMKAGVYDRINNQVSRLESEKEDLKDVGVRKELNLKQKFEREKNNIAESYQKNMDAYKNERDEAVRQGNERNHKDIAHVRGELEGLAVESNRAYRSHEDEQNKIHNLAFSNLKRDTEMRHKATQETADTRVMNFYQQAQEEKARLMDLQNENHIASQHSHQDDMRALRAAMDDDKQIAVNAMSEHIQNQEIQHQERMNTVVAKYEKQVQVLKDELMREKKMNSENTKRLVDEMQRMHKVAMDQVDSKSRDRLRQVNLQHSEELRTLNKRNEEKLDQVIGEIKRS